MNSLNPSVSKLILSKFRSISNQVLSRNVGHSRVITGRKKPTQLFPGFKKEWSGGQKYYRFTYYPRYPDQKDPDWKATPLFMVVRKKRVQGCPFWEKQLLKDFRIEQNNNEVAIVINCEQTNSKLWKIKHLVKIVPITFPDGIPEEKDLSSCRLYPNGELRFNPSLKIDPERMESTETFQKTVDVIDRKTIDKYTRQQWLNPWHNIDKY